MGACESCVSRDDSKSMFSNPLEQTYRAYETTLGYTNPNSGKMAYEFRRIGRTDIFTHDQLQTVLKEVTNNSIGFDDPETKLGKFYDLFKL
jgi:hypothetical protein